ncbi:MAG: protease modulator HflC [Acidobacteriota bacterium]
MNKMKPVFIVLIVLAIIFFMMGPYFIVEEGELAIVTRFGKIINTEDEAGLKFKLPVFDLVTKYPKKIQSWDGDARRLPTEENQFIWVDATGRWKISDLKKFYESVGTIAQAQSRLDDVIDSSVRKIIANNLLREAIRNSNVINDIERKNVFQTQDEETKEDKSQVISTFTDTQYANINKGRVQLTDEMLNAAKEITPQYGITLIDIIIRQIKYSDDLTHSVYNRMIKERNQIAQAFRSDGEGENARWLGKMERELKLVQSDAERKAKEIKAKADATALDIRNKAYSRDADFADFWMAIVQYQKIMPNLKKILTTDFEFFKYLYKKSGR